MFKLFALGIAFVCGPLAASHATSIPLVNHDDAWRYHKGTNAPQAGWKTVADASLDGTWGAGNGGFGYADNTAETVNCQTLLPDMMGSTATNYLTVYLRQQFTIAGPLATNLHLYLRMDFDDGYIAWLDGVYLTNRFVTGAPSEPAYTVAANASHESSAGNSTAQPAETNDLGLVSSLLGAGTHTLAILGLNNGKTSTDFILVGDLYLDTPPLSPVPVTNIWYASNSPIIINTNLTIAANSTLIIEPGTTVQFGAGVKVTVNGLLLAAGTPDKRIRMTRSGTASWTGFSFVGNHGSNVFAYVDIEYANGSGNGQNAPAMFYISDSQVTFERDTFLKTTGVKYMDIWYPQVAIRHNVFGDVGASYMIMVENLAPNGWFIVDGNLFGTDTGDTDIFHLNHVSVKDGPKAIIVNNVFTGAGDDHVDDNESDSHIEGNLFLNFTTNHPARSASCAVTTGEGSGVSTNLHTQRLTVVRNVFWGCDYGIINKDGSYVEVYNCVFVNNRGAIILDEPWRTDSGPGRACYVEGCIFWNNWPENGTDQGVFAYLTNGAAYTTGRYYRGATQVTVKNSILPAQYHYLGTGNLDVDPMFAFPTNVTALNPTNPAFAGGFDGFDANAFLLTNRLIPDVHLLPGSPAIGTGPNGTDMGIYVSDDASITGEPASPTTQSNATLTVGGLDISAYKYRLAGPSFTGAWSQEVQALKYVPAIGLTGTTATATCFNHGFANGDVIEVTGADSLCPYYNGSFPIRNVTANTFDYTVTPGTNLLTAEPLSIVWPIRNEGRTDIWCRKPQPVVLTNLVNGAYWVEAVRENSIYVWQDTNRPSRSRPWLVGPPVPPKVLSQTRSNEASLLVLRAESGQRYTVDFTDVLPASAWKTLTNINPPHYPTDIQIVDTNAAAPNRFYRFATPEPQ